MGAKKPRVDPAEIRRTGDQYGDTLTFPSPVPGLSVELEWRRCMGDTDRYIRIKRDGRVVLTLSEHFVSNVAFSLDGRRLYAQESNFGKRVQRVYALPHGTKLEEMPAPRPDEVVLLSDYCGVQEGNKPFFQYGGA